MKSFIERFLSKSIPQNEDNKIHYPVVKPGQDAYDVAYKWGWNSGIYKELIYLCYKTPDIFENAKRYFLSQEFTEVQKILLKLKISPSSQVHVLDFGCGNGIASYAFARLGFDVTAMDSSVSDIAGIKAAEKLLGADDIQFKIIRSEGEQFPFANESFDIVWIREALHHMHNLPEFLKNIAQVLKPNGFLFALREQVIWNEEQRQDMYNTHPFYPITKDEGAFYLDEYLKSFQQAGFEMLNILDPAQSVINYYPSTSPPEYSPEVAKTRKTGWDIYSFIARKKN